MGFGKGTPSKMLWVDGIDPDMSETVLERNMSKYGKVHKYMYMYMYMYMLLFTAMYMYIRAALF